MSSHELTPVSSTTSSSRLSSIFSCNVDYELAEQSSDDTATWIDSEDDNEDENLEPKTRMPTGKSIPSIPSRLEYRTRMASVLECIQNIQHQGDLMSEEVVPESHPILICLQLLRPAILLLPKLQQALGLEPVEIPEKYSTQTVCGCKEYIATKEDETDAFFAINIDIISASTLMGFANRFGSFEACSIHDMIFGEVGLLEMMRNLRMYCRDSGHVQSLPTTLRYAAATMYLDFFECCIEVLDERLEVSIPVDHSLQ
ncbi:hypothetical protein FOVG_17928 [Fusarium oxysporum f. sp. pisi HDV247]|uniref:Uncharacterized protein n=1 Tax=Fusarium oxysporum f. sp. pisi HDV247 TaxID=1080344 RepID=W9NL18_FUSOX|nr:hypothetical protein FOVG_17928 [Fusarium oxysporum f. sp. pisi HDV247]